MTVRISPSGSRFAGTWEAKSEHNRIRMQLEWAVFANEAMMQAIAGLEPGTHLRLRQDLRGIGADIYLSEDHSGKPARAMCILGESIPEFVQLVIAEAGQLDGTASRKPWLARALAAGHRILKFFAMIRDESY